MRDPGSLTVLRRGLAVRVFTVIRFSTDERLMPNTSAVSLIVSNAFCRKAASLSAAVSDGFCVRSNV